MKRLNPKELKGKRALVIGAGKSGVACANLLAAKGFKVLLTEEKPAAAVKEKLKALKPSVKTETGGHTPEVFTCGFAVKSPGMSHANPLIVSLNQKRIPVFSEVEIALAFSAGKLLAVTGTNGKTTTTILLGELMGEALRRRGRRALVCGNVGIPAALAAPKAGRGDCVVMEVSSYQLEDSSYLKPAAACLLNITPDHLDHHGSMAAYIKAKKKVFKFQDSKDCCVFNYEDLLCRKMAKRCPSRVLFFSSRRAAGVNAWTENGKLHFKTAKAEFSIQPPDLPGAHNLENAMCAGLMALEAGAVPADLKKVFAAFKGVEHRIEPSGAVRGIRFINDSKGTNVDSTVVALKALGGSRNIWLILGGQDKGNPYAPLVPLIKKNVKGVLTIGAAAPKIERELAGASPIITALTMENACREILELGERGDIALFSPACASFDQFKDFEDRGRKFKAFVKKLK